MKKLGQADVLQEEHTVWDMGPSKRDIFLALKDELHTGDKKSFPKYTDEDLIDAQKQVFKMRKTLKQQGVISDPTALSDENRRLELLDTTIVNYLQQLFTKDTDEYVVWERERGWDKAIASASQYNEERSAVIDTIKFDLDNLSDKELKTLFSILTEHDYASPVGEGNVMWSKQKIWNPVHYRNYALRYLPQLKEVFKTAKPIHISPNLISDKILYVTAWPWTWKIIEFKYNNFLNSNYKYDKDVYVVIHDSREKCKESLIKSIEVMTTEMVELKKVYDECIVFQKSTPPSSLDHVDWGEKLTSIHDKLEEISGSKFVQNVSYRVERSKENKKHMHDNQYRLMFAWIIRDIDAAIDEREVIIERYNQYVSAKKNLQ